MLQSWPLRFPERCRLALLGSWQGEAAEIKLPDPYAGRKKVLIIGDIHTGAHAPVKPHPAPDR